MVFSGFREKMGEKALKALSKMPGIEMAVPQGMKKAFDALNGVEQAGKDLLKGLRDGMPSSDLTRNALKVKEFISSNKLLFSSEQEQKDDLKACNALVDCVLKKQNCSGHISWLVLFLEKFSGFKKRLQEFFSKLLPS